MEVKEFFEEGYTIEKVKHLQARESVSIKGDNDWNEKLVFTDYRFLNDVKGYESDDYLIIDKNGEVIEVFSHDISTTEIGTIEKYILKFIDRLPSHKKELTREEWEEILLDTGSGMTYSDKDIDYLNKRYVEFLDKSNHFFLETDVRIFPDLQSFLMWFYDEEELENLLEEISEMYCQDKSIKVTVESLVPSFETLPSGKILFDFELV